MTNAPKNGTTPEPDPGSNSVSGRASYPLGYSALSGVSKGSPPLEGWLVRRRGRRTRRLRPRADRSQQGHRTNLSSRVRVAARTSAASVRTSATPASVMTNSIS